MNQDIKNMPYSEFVNALAKPGQDIINSLTPEKANLWHMASAICGEAGELFDAIKKNVIYEKKIDLENVVEELGDLEFYMQELRTQLSITRDQTIYKNKEKLSKRYEGLKFTNEAAQTRADK